MKYLIELPPYPPWWRPRKRKEWQREARQIELEREVAMKLVECHGSLAILEMLGYRYRRVPR